MSINVSEEPILEALHKILNEHWAHVLDFLHHLEPTVLRPPEGREPKRWTIADLFALPPEKRDAILEAQAALAAHDYRNNPELTHKPVYEIPTQVYNDGQFSRLSAQQASIARPRSGLFASPPSAART